MVEHESSSAPYATSSPGAGASGIAPGKRTVSERLAPAGTISQPAHGGGGTGPWPDYSEEIFSLHLDKSAAGSSTGAATAASGFEHVDKPRGDELFRVVVPFGKLPTVLQYHAGSLSSSAGEDIEISVLLREDHDVALYLGRTAKGHKGGVEKVINLKDVAAKLVVGTLDVSGKLAKLLAGSKDEPVLAKVGDDRVRLALSKKRKNGVRDFVVFSGMGIVEALVDGDWGALRPLEMQVTTDAGSVSRFEGEELTAEQAFHGKGDRIDPGFGFSVPGLRKVVFGEDGDEDVYGSLAAKGDLLTIGVSRDAAGEDGMAVSVDTGYVLQLAEKALAFLGDRAVDAFRAARKAGRAIARVVGAILEIDIGGGEPRKKGKIRWGLEAILRAIAAAGRFALDVLAHLIPDDIDLDFIRFVDPRIPHDWPEWPVVDWFDLPTDMIAEVLETLGDVASAVVGTAADAALDLAGLVVKMGLAIIDTAGEVIGIIIDFFSGGEKKRRAGFKLPIGRIAALVKDALALAGRTLGKGAEWFAEHARLGNDLVLRILLDDPPKSGGNRIGIDLKAFVLGGGDFDSLRLAETFLDGSIADISFGKTVPAKKDGATTTGASLDPAAVAVPDPGGAKLHTMTIDPPGWMRELWGLGKHATLESHFIIKNNDAMIWAKVVGSAAADTETKSFLIDFQLPGLAKKYVPGAVPKSVAIDEVKSAEQRRLVVKVGGKHDADGKQSKVSATMAWSLEQIFAAGSLTDALVPGEITLNAGAWSVTAGQRVSLAGWDGPMTTFVTPPRVREWLPGLDTVDVFTRIKNDRWGILFAETGDHADGEARGAALEVDEARIEQLRKRVPRMPGSLGQLDVSPQPDGLVITLGKADKDDSVSWIKFAWTQVVAFIVGDATLEDLIPHAAHLDAMAKSGLGLTYEPIRSRDDIPKDDPPLRRRVSEMPFDFGHVISQMGVSENAWIHLDGKTSVATGDLDNDDVRVAVKGAVYDDAEAGKVPKGYKLALEVDAIKLIHRFLPKSVVAKLDKRKKKKTKPGLDVDVDESKDPAGITVGIKYKKQRKNDKLIEVKVAGTWTFADLLELFMKRADVVDDPAMLAPSKLSGSLGNGRYKVTLDSDDSSRLKPTGVQLEGVMLALQQLMGQLFDAEIASNVQLWIDEDLEALPGRLIDALKTDGGELELAKSYLVIPGADGDDADMDPDRSRTYRMKLSVMRGELVNLAQLIPGGFWLKVAKLALDFVQDPEATLDTLFYTANILPLLVEHADIFSKVEWDEMSAGDMAMMLLVADDDMQAVYHALQAFDKLVDSGLVDKDKLKKLSPEDLKKALAGDPEEMMEQIQRINDMDMDELKKLAGIRDAAGSNEALNKITGFLASIPADKQQLLRKIHAMFTAHGVPFNPDWAKDFDPQRAIDKLGELDETVARLEAAVVGVRGEEAKRKLMEAANLGADGGAANDIAKDAYDGGVSGQPDLEVDTLTEEQLVAVVRDRAVMVTGPDGKLRLHVATPAERQAAARRLAALLDDTHEDQVEVDPEIALELYANDRDHSGNAAARASQELAGRGITLSAADIEHAMARNPRWFAKHGHGPAEFGAPNLDVGSARYAVHIATFQLEHGVSEIDGIAGNDTVALLSQSDAREERGEAEERYEAKKSRGGEGRSPDENKEGEGGRAHFPFTAEELSTFVSYDMMRGELVLIDGVEKNRLLKQPVVNKFGEAGVVYEVELRQRRASTESSDELQLGWWLVLRASYTERDENNKEQTYYFDMATRHHVFIVNGEGARSGFPLMVKDYNPIDDALRSAVDTRTGDIRDASVDVELDNGARFVATVLAVEPGSAGARVKLDVKAPSMWLQDIALGKWVEVPGQITMAVMHNRAARD